MHRRHAPSIASSGDGAQRDAIVTPASARPRVLCVVNRPGWAHDRKTDALARVLADRYELDKRFQADLTAADLEAADAILFYYWLQIDELPHLRPLLRARRDRLLLGVCSHHELGGAWRMPALATLAEARAVFVNNRLLLDELEPLLPVPLYYTPNGVDTTFFRPPQAPRPASPRLRVGWAGSLVNHGPTHRGVQEVIAPAAAMVGAELCLAAREEKWRTAAEIYQAIDVYVCASRSEGTPNPCLEAAACGLPVVTTAVGNMPELIREGESGFLVERRAEDVAARLALLRDDAALRARMGAAARAAVEAWDWRQQARRYEPLFDLVLRDVAVR
jgi:glycosyltransferase involved in cell wall biosynthesis